MLPVSELVLRVTQSSVHVCANLPSVEECIKSLSCLPAFYAVTKESQSVNVVSLIQRDGYVSRI